MRGLSIWWFAFGYFACYAPYSALAKLLSRGQLDGMAAPLDGMVLLPATVLTSVVGMFTFLSIARWWRFATHRQVGRWSVPSPQLRTLISGTCTAVIVVTTTMAYTFEGISIVFAMLLMRGGVLIIAPMVDALSHRRVRWTSWTALVLSILALLVAFVEKDGFALSAAAALDIGLYLAAYFVRLRIMSGSAKSEDPDANTRYFVEEQMVATPLVMVVLAAWAVFGSSPAAVNLQAGFLDIWTDPALIWVLAVGLFSQGTGIFGGLILLDKRENTFCVPVNRASSILAGLVASAAMALMFGAALPSNYELAGAALVIVAIAVLSLPSLWPKATRPSA